MIAWSGMRGGVSLAAALAITADGFPKRDLVIFVAYAVILLTLVLPGLTLSTLVKRLGLQESEEHRRQDAEARMKLTQAALDRLDELEGEAPDHVVQRLRDRYGSRLERLEARVEGDSDEDGQTDVAQAGKLMAEMIEAERELLRDLRKDGDVPRRRAARDGTRARSRRLTPACQDSPLTMLAAILETDDPERLYMGLSLLVSTAAAGRRPVRSSASARSRPCSTRRRRRT